MPTALNWPSFFIRPCSMGCGRIPSHAPTLMVPRADSQRGPVMLALDNSRCLECQAAISVADMVDSRGREEIEVLLLHVAPYLDQRTLQWDAAWIKWDPIRSDS